jgi:hypothetical protein
MASAMEGCEWEVDEAAYYIAGDQVLKARVKRRLPSETKDADFVLQTRKDSSCRTCTAHGQGQKQFWPRLGRLLAAKKQRQLMVV